MSDISDPAVGTTYYPSPAAPPSVETLVVPLAQPGDPGQPPITYGSQPAEALPVHDVVAGNEPIVVDRPYAEQTADTNTLTCTAGNWEGEPTSRDYHWLCDGVAIAMMRDPSYTLQPDDDGHTFACQLIVANAYGSSLPALSNDVVAAYVAPPVIEVVVVPTPTFSETTPNPQVAINLPPTHMPPPPEPEVKDVPFIPDEDDMVGQEPTV
jgi:hypothetical protein